MTVSTRRIAAATLVSCLCLAPRVALADDSDQCLDASSSAQDLRREKKLVQAREKLLACARESCPAVVRRDCAQWLAELDAQLPTVVITAKDARGADVVDARVSIDGAAVAERLDGTSVPINPGIHVIRIVANGSAPLEQNVVIREGEKNRTLELTIAPAQATPTVTPPPDNASPPPPPPPRDDDASPTPTRRIVGLAAMGVGVVGLGIGSVFGLKASSQWSDAQDTCGKGCAPGSAPYSQRDDAKSSATIATISVVAGLALVGGGAFLFFTAPSKRTAAVTRALAHFSATGYETSF